MRNRVTEIIGVRFPLIQGPMRKITLSSMAAAVSESGALGQIASSGLSLSQLRDEICKAKQLTNRPFGINIPLHRPHAFDILELAVKMGVEIITTSGGNPTKFMERAKDSGIRVLHKVSTVQMGLKAQEAGVSGVIGMGFEAGGHGGRDQVTTFCLIPRLVDALEIPVIAAGGVSDFRGFLAALALGAEGVEIGTRFLISTECDIPPYYKDAIIKAADTGTVVIGDGAMTLRVLKNQRTESLGNINREKIDILQRANLIEGIDDKDRAVMVAGQCAGLIKNILPIHDIVMEFAEKSRHISKEIEYFLKED